MDSKWTSLATTSFFGQGPSRILLIIGCLCASMPVVAEISFEEVTQGAMIVHEGPTYGASWGDIDGDGWPDLWVGNHNSKPSLYRNQRDGQFVNVIDKVWDADPGADTHGTAWADFDNDGDQDLVELVGALENKDGTFCFGCGRNHLFLNERGLLVERAAQFGLDSKGLARSPLWLDADRDGRLDLLVVNTRAGSSLPASTVFRQGAKRFRGANAAFGFLDERWSRSDEYLGWARNALEFRFETIGLLNTHRHQEFAQLAGLLDDRQLALVLFSLPARVYSISDTLFADKTAAAGFPMLDMISDAAIEDFNGDGKLDMYLTLGPHYASDIVHINPKQIEGTLAGHREREPMSLVFQAEGPVQFEIHPAFLSLSKVFIGSRGGHPGTRSFSLSPEDPEVSGPASPDAASNGGVSITYDSGSGNWILSNTSKGSFVDFIIRTTSPITKVQTRGFTAFRERGVDALLVRRDDHFSQKKISGEAGAETACHSVVAGDFDNDMDIDLYLVCTGPLENLPNRLLENDGKGNFYALPDAGGASGSALGRGDVVAMADYDRDGFLDLFVANGMDPASPFVEDGPHQLFHNRGNDNHWIEVDLEGVQSNRDGIGATITLEAGGVIQIREQRGGMHRIAQNYKRLHFGLGENRRVDKMTIRWPSGTEQVIKDMAIDRIVQIREGDM